MRDLQAHVDKLTEILDSVHACNDDCDLAAVLAWVDPEDRQRVRELRSRLKMASTTAMHLLEQAADTLELERGKETVGTGKMRASASELRILLGE